MLQSISLVIITNNSSLTIGKTLKSVSGLVDEIIFIDTGITDNTLEIARIYNSKIYPFVWENNFSKPRNIGIDKASGKWILILDADEYISENDSQKIKEAVNDDTTGVFIFKQKSNKDFSSPTFVSSIRLFRNIDILRYKYAVHEMIPTDELKKYNLGIKTLDIEIEHSGYQTNELSKHKEKRNLNILKTQLLKKELSDDEFFHYGVYFLRSNLNISSQSSLEKNIGLRLISIKDKLLKQDTFNINQDFFIFYTVISNFFIKYPNISEIETLFNEAIIFYKDSPFIFFKFAEAYFKSEKYNKSIELLERCIKFSETGYNQEQLIDPGILNDLSYSALVKCYEKCGDFINAEKYSVRK